MIHLQFTPDDVKVHKEYGTKLIRSRVRLYQNTLSKEGKYIFQYLDEHLEQIIAGEPEELRKIIRDFERPKLTLTGKPKEIFDSIKECFSYDKYSQQTFGHNVTEYALNEYKLKNRLPVSAKWRYHQEIQVCIVEVLESYRPGFSKDFLKEIENKSEKPTRSRCMEILNQMRQKERKRIRKPMDFWACSNPYWLEQKLGLKTYPYCNRQFITVLENDDLHIRTDLDHFWPKKMYPYLSVSMFNLVPSCGVCNSSLKGTREFATDDLSPYEFALGKKAIFHYDSLRDHTISLNARVSKDDTIVQKYKDMFALEKIYQTHVDMGEWIHDLYEKYHGYSKLDIWKESGEKFALTEDELYKLLFGSVCQEDKVLEECLGLLKRNLIEDIWGEEVLKKVDKGIEKI